MTSTPEPPTVLTIPLFDPYEGVSDGAVALAALRIQKRLAFTAQYRSAVDPDELPDFEGLLGEQMHVQFAALDAQGVVTDLVAASDDIVVRVSRYRLPTVGISTAVWGRTRPVVISELRRLASVVPTRPAPNHVAGEVEIEVQSGNLRYVRTLDLPAWSDIAGNYTGSVREAMERLLEELPPEPRGPRLVVVAGEPGGGKTWLCRALLREAAERDMDIRLAADPGDIAGLLPTSLAGLGTRERFEMCLVEDADAVLIPFTGRRNPASSGLLNSTDGLVAETLRGMWVLTTNLPLSGVDPAMLRPGRAMAVIEVPPLPASEANAWLRRRGTAVTVNEPTVLAQLYEMLREPASGPQGRSTPDGYV